MSTIKLRNGGKIVRVTENELEKYLTKGYVRVEKKVEEVQNTVPQKPIISTVDEPEKEIVEEPKKNTARRNKSNK